MILPLKLNVSQIFCFTFYILWIQSFTDQKISFIFRINNTKNAGKEEEEEEEEEIPTAGVLSRRNLNWGSRNISPVK